MSEIYASIAAVMNGMTAIGKEKKNEQQNFKYRGIDDVYNSLNPLMTVNGMFTTPEVLERVREERINTKGTVLAFVTLRIKYTFWAKDGSSVFCIVEGEGMDSGDKATSKAMAIAHKYALLQTFCIPTEDMVDPDSESHNVAHDARAAKREQNKQLRANIHANDKQQRERGQQEMNMGYALFEVQSANTEDDLVASYRQHSAMAADCGRHQELIDACSKRKAAICPPPEPKVEYLTDGQRKAIMRHYGTTDKTKRLGDMSAFLARDVDTFTTLTKDEASRFIDAINTDKDPQLENPMRDLPAGWDHRSDAPHAQ